MSDLDRAAVRLAAARTETAAAASALADAVRAEHAATVASESSLAARAGVSRMTVRGWLGRPVPVARSRRRGQGEQSG